MDVGMVKIEQRKDLGTEELCRQLDLVLPVRNGQHSPQINMDIPQISKNLKKMCIVLLEFNYTFIN